MMHVFPYSDGYVQPLVCLGSNFWQHYQEYDHIAEERWQACLGGLRWLQAHNFAKQLKILARVLANCLQLVISDLIGPKQNYAVKERLIQDNLHLVLEILERLKDDTEARLINLDQSKAFDRVDHRFLVTVLETAGFEPEFRK